MADIFIEIINLSYQSGIIILILLLVRGILKFLKVPKRYIYCLWGIAFIRMICPLQLESFFSIMPKENKPIKTEIMYELAPQIHTGSEVVNSIIEKSLPKGQMSASVNPMQIVIFLGSLIWLTGVFLLLVFHIVSYIKLKGRLVGSVLWKEEKKEKVYLADHIGTAFVLGFRKPMIYLPSDLTKQEIKYVLSHEREHMKRKDYLVKPILFVITIIHWFNPLVWLALTMAIKDMEMACDEAVLQNAKEDIRKEYAISLMNLSVKKNGLKIPLAFGEGNVKMRIKNILAYKKPLAVFGIIMVIGILVLSVALLTVPKKASKLGETADSYSLETKELLEKEVSEKEVSGEKLTVSEPVIDLNGGLGADGVFLDYADDEIVIFHGYFGLFVYSVKEEQMLHAIDLEPIGCNYTQGENACEVFVSEDGKRVYLHSMSSEVMYVYDLMDRMMYEEVFSLEGVKLFSEFADNSVLEEEPTVFRSERVAILEEGGKTYYGYLLSGSGMLTDLCYVSGEDNIFSLFQSQKKTENPWSSSLYGFAVKEETITQSGGSFIIYNNSDKEIMYGESYKLKRKDGDNWSEISPVGEIAYHDIAYMIEPASDSEIEVQWQQAYGELPKGIYLLEKEIGVGDNEWITLGVQFTVEE